MAFHNNWQIEHDAIGISINPAQAFREVCSECIADPGLRLFVSRNRPIERCNFCGSADRHGVDVDHLFEYMAGCLRSEWEDPTGSVGWCSAEGGWLGAAVIDTWDLLETIGDPFESDELRDLFISSFEHEWCQRDPYSMAFHDRLIFGWELFSEYVRHSQRQLFLSQPTTTNRDHDRIDPTEMLDHVGKAIANVQHHLLKVLDAGRSLVRGREHDAGEQPVKSAELGSPPRATAISTRMSPAGISVFYAAEDVSTVLLEARPSARLLTVATWTTTRDLVYLDLVDLPEVPSIFDMTGRVERTWLRFLNRFAEDTSRATGSNPEVDYIPTQIFTEYVRTRILDSRGRPVEGIRFRSSLDPDGACWVLFVDEDECADAGDERDCTVVALQADTVVRYRPGWSPTP